MNHPLPKRLVAEAVGTAMMLAAVAGSNFMGARLAVSDIALRQQLPAKSADSLTGLHHEHALPRPRTVTALP